MQAIIMAAGKGSRISDKTNELPKCFLEVNGVKLIDYNLALLDSVGVQDIIVVTGYKNDVLEGYLSKYNNVRCQYNPFYEQTNVIGSFFMAQHMLNDDVLYLHADTLCEPSIFNRMVNMSGDMVLPVDFDTVNEEAMKVITQNDNIVKISKQIELDVAEGEFIGVLKMSKIAVTQIKNHAKNLMEQKVWGEYFEAAIQRLIDVGGFDIRAMPTDKRFWGEIDFAEDYEKVCKEIPPSFVDSALEFVRVNNG